jgi:hypothetical protein
MAQSAGQSPVALRYPTALARSAAALIAPKIAPWTAAATTTCVQL